jgi:hypothetical protein
VQVSGIFFGADNLVSPIHGSEIDLSQVQQENEAAQDDLESTTAMASSESITTLVDAEDSGTDATKDGL